jgi:predicted transcriptional regulator
MPLRNEDMLKARLAIVERHIAEGTGLKTAAEEIGISPPGLSQYLDAAGYRDLRIRLGENTKIGCPLPFEERVLRMRTLATSKSQAEAARKLGISPPAMSKWLKDNGYSRNFQRELEEMLDEEDDYDYEDE